MSVHLTTIQQLLLQSARPEAKLAREKFISDTVKTYGVYNPVLNMLAKQFKEGGFKLVEELWKAGAWEEKIMAGKMLGLIAKKDPVKAIQLVKKFSASIEDWAVCDTLGMQALKPLVQTHSKEIFTLASELNNAQDVWQKRLSLVLAEWYTRDKRYHAAIDQLIRNLEHDDAYYVKKAITWLRKNFEKGK